MDGAKELQPAWQVTLFGEMQFFRGEGSGGPPSSVPVRFRATKARLVLAYLLLHPEQAHSREFLAAQFWPESSDGGAARRSLRDALAAIRDACAEAGLPVDALAADRNTLRIAPGVLSTDVAAFEAALSRASARPLPPAESRLASLEEAVSLYRGPLLRDDFDIAEAEEWIEPARRRCAIAFEDALSQLSVLHAAQGDLRQALLYARRYRESNPEDEARAERVRQLEERVRQAEHASFAPAPGSAVSAPSTPPPVSPVVPPERPAPAPVGRVPFTVTVAETETPPSEEPVPSSRPSRRARIGGLALLSMAACAAVLGPAAFLKSSDTSSSASRPAARSGDPGDLGEINALLAPAAQAMEKEDYERALGYYLSVLPKVNSRYERLQVGQKLLVLAKSAHYRDKGEGFVALAALEAALRIFRADKLPQSAADTLLLTANVTMLRGERNRAVACVEEASRIVSTLDSGVDRAGLMHRIGQLALGIGDYDRARDNLERALAMYRQGTSREHQRGVAFVLWSLGPYASDTGDYAAAKKYLTEAAARMAALGDERQTRAAVLGDLGDVHFREKDSPKALAFYREGLQEWERVGQTYWTAVFKARLALLELWRAEDWAWSSRTRPPETPQGKAHLRAAETLARESLELLKGSSGPVGRALPLGVLGNTFYHQSQYPQAKRALRESVSLRRQVGNPCALAEALETLAVFESRVEENGSARRHAQEADALRKKAGTPVPPRYQSSVDGMRQYLGLPRRADKESRNARSSS